MYDIPEEVVAEGIVNAVAHRDYTSNASVEVQLFPDRLEIWNPGTVHPPLTLEKLLLPHASQPNNPLIAEPFFLTKYIEKAGSGTVDMVKRCRKAGMQQPEFRVDSGYFILTVWRKRFAAAEDQAEQGVESGSGWHQVEILHKCLIDTGITELMEIAGRTDRTKFRNQVLNPLIEAGLLEMTVLDKPRSSKQKYRVTEEGRDLLIKQPKEVDADEK